ncbi:MAG: hypothetical protein JRG96_12920 [Deltaproteobacteria bacterium]|nr:hypothetical protein [Deltaproteobacteria bacterium]MBW2419710.1 hypothetical protein [Deltaproteobacteria bacterium]
MREIVAVTLALAVALPAWGAEIDGVTSRRVVLGDSTRHLDRWTNERLRRGVDRANARGEACDEEALYDELRRAISSPFIGHLVAEELNADPELDSRRIPLRDSIYRDLGLFDAVSVHVKNLSAVVRMSDHVVGVDKLGHFFVQGWKYFDIAYREGDGVPAAASWGERSERSYFGLYTTGIYSHADLVANLEGMRFWLRILGDAADPLDEGYFRNRPYVACRRRLVFGERRWRVRRKVRLRHYVTGAWDEAINCCDYRSPEIRALVEGRIEEQASLDGVSYACPLEPAACVAAKERYGALADRLLHPRCLAAEGQRRPWWKFW